jgi:arylsulfatase A-like enzyme
LLIAFPAGAPAGRSVRGPVSHLDLAATVVERLGLADQSPFPGRTLARFWDHAAGRGDTSAEPVRSELIRGGWPNPEFRWPPAVRGPMQSLADDGTIYIRNGDGVEELYDIEADRAEAHDLAGSADRRPALERFRALTKDLERHLKEK